MANQVALTHKEIEKYTGISGLDVAKTGRVILLAATTLRTYYVIRGVKTVALTGGAMGTEMGLIYTNVTTALGTSGMFLLSIFCTIGTAIYAIVALALPVVEAKQIVGERNIKHGFATGVAIGVLNYGKPMFHDFFKRTVKGGFAPFYMRGVAEKAYNIGITLGYSASIKLSASDKENYRNVLTEKMVREAKSSGYKLYMDNWTDRTWVNNYTGAVMKL